MTKHKPSEAQIKALHHVLYERKRLHRLRTLQHNIAVLMNLNPEAELSSQDARAPAGSGPTWFLPANGAVDPLVLEAAKYGDEIAATLMSMHDDVAKVDFPHHLRAHVTAALKAEAASWTTRAAFWRSPTKPDVDAVVKSISGHVQDAIDHAKPVAKYFKSAQAVGV